MHDYVAFPQRFVFPMFCQYFNDGLGQLESHCSSDIVRIYWGVAWHKGPTKHTLFCDLQYFENSKNIILSLIGKKTLDKNKTTL